MTRIDQFESAFKSATKSLFVYQPPPIRTVLLVSDLDGDPAKLLGDRARRFLAGLEEADRIEWVHAGGGEACTVGGLLEKMEAVRPDLVCTYRNVHTGAWQWPYSLGDHVEVLTQATTTPILLLPRPDRPAELFERYMVDTREVMAVTGQLTGDRRLVSAAAAFTARGGTLFLAHVEDGFVFERYMDAIGKVPSIDTDDARQRLLEQLLKEPQDYGRSCRQGLEAAGLDLEIQEVVALGHPLTEYRKLIDANAIDLLVLHTKDDDQLAMHGLAYPLVVELRDIPTLLL